MYVMYCYLENIVFQVKIYVDSDRVGSDKVEDFKLWSMNPITGIWELEQDFQVNLFAVLWVKVG